MSFIEIILAGFVLLFLTCTRIGTFEEDVFDRRSTAALRGVAMMCIILHHIHNKCAVGTPLLAYIGFISTGIFFFISGYGNEISLSRGNITWNWIKAKFIKIYVPFFVTYICYYVMLIFMYPHAVPEIKTVMKEIFTLTLPNQVTWFPKVILVVFLGHWLLKIIIKFIWGQNRMLVFFCILSGCIIYGMAMHSLGFAAYWYNSVFCYPLGILFSLWKKRRQDIRVLISRNIITLMLLVVFAWFAYIRKVENWDIIWTICVSVICYYYTAIFSIKCCVLEWVGNNSFEFYLFHSLCLRWFIFLIEINKTMYGLCVIAVSFLLVYIYIKIQSLFRHRWGKK